MAKTVTSKDISKLCINAIRILSMDAVQKAKSGHPGTPMALAPLCYVLWTRHLRHNPNNPQWANRDRFVLSCGHASMLLYSLLHLSGYELSLDDLKNFRQWGSKTPGHPEVDHELGIETTTGPLGQGLTNAVGMAIAEVQLAAAFNHTGHYIVDHHTYFVASDGDMMEGISHEAASLAGHLGLGKLIGFWDCNGITIEGSRSLADSEDVAKRYEAYGWDVQVVENANEDLSAIDDAIEAARAELVKPSLIIVKTEIAFGSPNKHGTSAAHGSPLGEEEIALTRENLGWPWSEEFYVPDEARDEWALCKERGTELEKTWKKVEKKYAKAFPAEHEELGRRLEGKLPPDWEDALPAFDPHASIATRAASGSVINALAPVLPELNGGSADLAPSNDTSVEEGGDFASDRPSGRNLHFGIREHAMGAIMNGMALHGGLRPYGGTFLVFSDYMRPSLRLAALMGQPTIYVFTHDSIGLGEDGPTHQPVEQLAALRAIPGFTVMRPADATEVSEAWRFAIKSEGPVALVLTRQKLPLLDRGKTGGAERLAYGGYVIREAGKGAGTDDFEPELVLVGSGSEVYLLLQAQDVLAADGRATRVVSMPCLELFGQQSDEYRASILPEGVPTLAVEAAHPMPWYRWIGSRGEVIGIERFGASAPYERVFEEYGITTDAIVSRAKAMLQA